MGEFVQAGSWSILGYIMMNSKTVGQAFEKANRYSRIVGDLVHTQPESRSNRIKFIYSAPAHAPNMSRHCFEAAITSSVCMIRTITGIKLQPLEVCFTSSQPERMEEYERVFGCPVYFEQKENSLTVDESIIRTPILMPNPELLEHFENYAREFLTTIDRRNEYTHKVTKLILSYLDEEKISIESIAREMNVSVRTLQNRLQEEGVIFSELLRDIRVKLAKKYLQEEHSVETIAYLLGFSEPSVFRKAFKKWSGVTPKEYRDRSGSIRRQA
jgi:AraC-like DNA-binding protein